ncbi:HNH endonuclease [Acinetobacter faecalis]|uniref:HNH endonuclease n=1 Tax=Acinetobacter faecalis TaxID=2665161 RepID=UPI002A909767|nr:HNH endonuclease [Acinetobacter faecalis]MDY6511736.1 HNH endonuclease [Acinetobacter faecalis]
MNNCALCNDPIIETNQTEEHVIPQAIGGRLKIKNFICRTCNSKYGHSWDNVLADQLAFFSTSLNIIREKKTPSYLVTDIDNKQYLKHPKGDFFLVRPVTNIESNADGSLNINIQAPNQKVAKQILEKVSKEYNLSNENQILMLKSLANRISPMDKVIKGEINFGGEESGRSLVKTALALAFTIDIDLDQCDLAKEYLLNGGIACFGYFYSPNKDFVKNRNKDIPFHCVYIKADSQLGRIFGYIEYFGAFRVVLSLATDYRGETKEAIYCIDPTSKQIIDLKIDLDLSDDDIERIYNYEIYNLEVYQESIGNLLDKVIFQSKINNLNNRFSEAMKAWDQGKTYDENISNAMKYLEPHFKEILKLT